MGGLAADFAPVITQRDPERCRDYQRLAKTAAPASRMGAVRQTSRRTPPGRQARLGPAVLIAKWQFSRS